jgi:hypothetical protein
MKSCGLQYCTLNYNINWSQSIPKIDQQLFKKYNLSEEEIAFIESMIKPMDLTTNENDNE